MATQSQAQFELNPHCEHEALCHDAYDRHRRRLRTLCQWMTPDASQARQLETSIYVEAWRQGPPRGADWAAGDDGREVLLQSLAARFEPLFHADAAAENGEGLAAGPQLVPGGQARLGAAIQGLPRGHRLLYLLHEVEGYPAGKLAGWLNLNRSHCAQLIHEARVWLRQRLQAA